MRGKFIWATGQCFENAGQNQKYNPRESAVSIQSIAQLNRYFNRQRPLPDAIETFHPTIELLLQNRSETTHTMFRPIIYAT